MTSNLLHKTAEQGALQPGVEWLVDYPDYCDRVRSWVISMGGAVKLFEGDSTAMMDFIRH